MTSRKNFPSRIKARRLKAVEQVKARVKANGKASDTSPERKLEITADRQKQRLEQAKHELALLEKRV